VGDGLPPVVHDCRVEAPGGEEAREGHGDVAVVLHHQYVHRGIVGTNRTTADAPAIHNFADLGHISRGPPREAPAR
jgi:hypothetical protein